MAEKLGTPYIRVARFNSDSIYLAGESIYSFQDKIVTVSLTGKEGTFLNAALYPVQLNYWRILKSFYDTYVDPEWLYSAYQLRGIRFWARRSFHAKFTPLVEFSTLPEEWWQWRF